MTLYPVNKGTKYLFFWNTVVLSISIILASAQISYFLVRLLIARANTNSFARLKEKDYFYNVTHLIVQFI